MKIKMSKGWRKLKVCRADLQLSPTLGGGQSFRWKNVESQNWIGVFKSKVWILSQEDNHLLYKAFDKASNNELTVQIEEPCVGSDKETENMLKSYFRLDVDLSHYYKIWAEADPCFREAAPKMFGIRILNQDVIENIFSFICSSNNNIKRISSMIEKLCKLYGEEIAEVNKETFHSFPTVEKLSGSTVESDLRNAGFGYRAKFIYKSACFIKEMGGTVWLENLKLLPYQEAKKELMKLPGIGAKVADCICLMSLGHMEAVPVDTHIFQVATKTYLPHLQKYKTLTDKVYNEIGDHFRALHGSYAGWANTVLAKKGSSEEDGYGYDGLQVWPQFRPGHAPKPHKFKGPKHQYFVVGRPQYYPQGPQYPQYPQQPQPEELQGMSPREVVQYLDNKMKQMQLFSVKAYKEFQAVENEIDRNRKQVEDIMKSQFQTLELVLEDKQSKEVEQAVKDGKDELKIQECLAVEENDFRADMNADIQRTVDCVMDATERARKVINDARNAFTESSVKSAMQVKEWAQITRVCSEHRNTRCIREGAAYIESETKRTVEEGGRYFENLQKAPQNQMIQMQYCHGNFRDDLKDMKDAYSKMVKRCVIASEIQEPEQEADENAKETGKPNINVDVKPDVQPEIEIQA